MRQIPRYYFFTYFVKFLIYFACCTVVTLINELIGLLIGFRLGSVLCGVVWLFLGRYFGKKWNSYRDNAALTFYTPVSPTSEKRIPAYILDNDGNYRTDEIFPSDFKNIIISDFKDENGKIYILQTSNKKLLVKKDFWRCLYLYHNKPDTPVTYYICTNTGSTPSITTEIKCIGDVPNNELDKINNRGEIFVFSANGKTVYRECKDDLLRTQSTYRDIKTSTYRDIKTLVILVISIVSVILWFFIILWLSKISM